jgi:guanylate kinase
MGASFRLSEPAFPIVVSGPSGVGKTVLCRRLIDALPRLARSISATTRPIRPGETDGESYIFWSEARFREEQAGDGLAEWALVHGHHYGTPRSWLDARLAAGVSPVLNIDVQGAAQMRRVYPSSLLVFILPPSMKELEKRLRGRETDAHDEIRRRLETAKVEIGRLPEYDHVVVNDRLEAAVDDLVAVVRGERARVSRRLPAGWRFPEAGEVNP